MFNRDIMLEYSKDKEPWRENYLNNSSIKLSLTAHSLLVKEGAYHPPVVLFTKESMDTYQPVPVLDLLPVIFLGGPIEK